MQEESERGIINIMHCLYINYEVQQCLSTDAFQDSATVMKQKVENRTMITKVKR
jgi:hypothetical protein